MNRLTCGPLVVLVAIGFALAGCDDSSSQEDPATIGDLDASDTGGDRTETVADIADEPAPSLTYHKDIRPIVVQHCTHCHQSEGIAPEHLDFTNPETVLANAEVAFAEVDAGRMPPWPLNEDCGPEYRHDPAVTFTQISQFEEWILQGKQMGDPAEYVPPSPIYPLSPNREEGLKSTTLAPPAAWTPRTAKNDAFRCFSFSPDFDSLFSHEDFLLDELAVESFDVEVDNRDILRQVSIYQVPAEDADAVAALESEDDDPGYDCSVGPRIDGARLLATWHARQASGPFRTNGSPDIGDLIVLQYHYNSAGDGWGPDQTQVKLNVFDGFREVLGAELKTPFEVPPGVDGISPDTQCDVVYQVDGELPDTATPEGIPLQDVLEEPTLVGSTGCVSLHYYTIAANQVSTRHLWSIAALSYPTTSSLELEMLRIDLDTGQPELFNRQCLLSVPAWEVSLNESFSIDPDGELGLPWLELPSAALFRLTCRFDNSDSTLPLQGEFGARNQRCGFALFSNGRL